MDMHRKIELQSPADYTYLYANTINLSRQKLDLHLPPSASNNNGVGDDAPDPMRERVRELVDEYITKTFTTASTSLNVNGLDDDHQFPLPATTNSSTLEASLQAPAETVEYEPFDTKLAARVTSLYAQLESLTTTVAQLRRDAPRKAARLYAEELERVLEDEDDGGGEGGVDDFDYDYEDDDNRDEGPSKQEEEDVEMADAGGHGRSRKTIKKPDWKIHVPLSSDAETQRWRNGEMAEVYEDTLRTLLRLQGEADEVGTATAADATGTDGNALATTVGKAERAGRAAEVVEKM